jgi:hypothetical protein
MRLWLAAALWTWFVAEPAVAQQQYGWQPPPPGYVPVVIRGDRPGLRYSVALDKDERPFAYCPYDCTLQLAVGRYWLRVHEAPGIIDGQRRFEIEGPSEARVTPRTEEERSAGKTMGYVGVGLLVGGFVATLWGIGEAVRGDEDRATWALLLGIGGMATGAVLTPIGFVRGGRVAPRIEVEPMGKAAR